MSKNAAKYGRKQHAELPKTASDQEIIGKVTRMLALGVIALAAAASSLIYLPEAILIAPLAKVLIVAYEAAQFRYRKIYCEFTLSVVLAVVTTLVFL